MIEGLPNTRSIALVRFLQLLFTLVLAMGLIAPAAAGAAVASDYPDLLASRKLASHDSVIGDQVFTYTIRLENTGTADAHVSVADPIPDRLTYVEGSVSDGGTYDEDPAVVSWEQVPVAAGETVDLTFDVRADSVESATEVLNVAAIMADNQHFFRMVKITILPGDGPEPPPNYLNSSSKIPSRRYLGPDQELSYTIRLSNHSDTDLTASVVDPLPEQFNYIDGSASDGGTYDSESRTLSWDDIVVPGESRVDLTFDVTGGQVDRPMAVANVATISYDDVSFERQAVVVLLPTIIPPAPRPILAAVKTASKRVVEPDEVLSYNILLINSGTADEMVDVVDPLPGEVTYVGGADDSGGSYDPSSRTVSWSDVTVPAGDHVSLTFDVRAGEVDKAAVVVNTATVNTESRSYERSARIVIVSDLPAHDVSPPRVESVSIDQGDVVTNPNVTLTIDARDDVGLRSMVVQEWALSDDGMPRWQVVQESGWIPFQAKLAWTLTGRAGVHYMTVTVADKANNMSTLTGSAMDYASLLLAGQTVGQDGRIPFFVHYEAGADVSAMLTTMSGDADLYVWFPDEFGSPNRSSTEDATSVDAVSFTAPVSGRYVFLVHGHEASTYNLALAPSSATGSQSGSATVDASKERLQSLIDLILSGLDPLAAAEAPTANHMLHMPVVAK